MPARRLKKTQAHLEITAFINLIVVLVPFLLIHSFLQAKTAEIVDGLEGAKFSFLNLVQRLKLEHAAGKGG